MLQIAQMLAIGQPERWFLLLRGTRRPKVRGRLLYQTTNECTTSIEGLLWLLLLLLIGR